MLFNAILSKDFCVEAVATTCYLVKCSPSSSIECKTLEEIWYDHPVDYSNLKVFCCPAYTHVDDGKPELGSKKCIFVGYASGVKG